MLSPTEDTKRIEAIIHAYFDALHQGNTKVLSEIFHPDAWLKAPNSRRSLSQWLNDVENRPRPDKLGHQRQYKILAIDVIQDQAMVKVHCPLFEFNYVDFLGLLNEQGQWRIVTKMYTNVQRDIKK